MLISPSWILIPQASCDVSFYSRKNAPTFEEAFYREETLRRHLKTAHGMKYSPEQARRLGTIN